MSTLLEVLQSCAQVCLTADLIPLNPLDGHGLPVMGFRVPSPAGESVFTVSVISNLGGC